MTTIDRLAVILNSNYFFKCYYLLS